MDRDGLATGRENLRGTQLTGAIYGIAAAALFGLSAPLAKILVREATPLALAGLLYLGAGLGLSLTEILPGLRSAPRLRREAPLRAADLGLFGGVLLSGGVVGPLLMLSGLQRLSGVAASLLLNLEAPFTMLLAVAVFAEHLGVRALLAGAAIVLGAVVLNIGPARFEADPVGVLAVAGACLSWGLDNNLTQRLSLRDPVAVARLKGLGAGGAMLAVALLLRLPLPGARTTAAALLLGAISYGLSVGLDVVALRLLGAAREAAFFATAPFAGAVGATVLLGEGWTMAETGAAVLMAIGVGLLVRERHAHRHSHEALGHEHLHVHDEHHRHDHGAGNPGPEPHSHPHRHAPLTHDHSHVSDAHHRHGHARGAR